MKVKMYKSKVNSLGLKPISSSGQLDRFTPAVKLFYEQERDLQFNVGSEPREVSGKVHMVTNNVHQW